MSTIKSKEDLTHVVANDDLFPSVNNAGDTAQSVSAEQIVQATTLPAAITAVDVKADAGIAAAAAVDVKADANTVKADANTALHLQSITNGKVLTVGIGTGNGTIGDGVADGHFQYLEQALQFVKDNSAPVSVKGDMDGTITTTLYDDTITLVGSTVSFNPAFPDPEWAGQVVIDAGLINTHLMRRSFIMLDNDGRYRPYKYVLTNTTIELSAGWEKASASGLAWDVFVIPEYTIILLPGRQRMSRDYGKFTFGSTPVNVDIIGMGKNVSICEFFGANDILPPVNGHLGLDKHTIMYSGTRIPYATPNLSISHSVGLDFTIGDIIVQNTEASVTADVFNIFAARIVVDNLNCIARGDTLVFASDDMMIRNIRLDTIRGSGIGRLEFRFMKHHRNKNAYINNIVGDVNPTAVSNYAGAFEEVDGAGGANVKEIYAEDFVLPDGDLYLNSDNGKVNLHLADSVCLDVIAGLNSTANLGNVRRFTGPIPKAGTGNYTAF